jgi:hypothetical protein
MEKDTIQIITSIATPCIALIAVIYAGMQAKTAKIKRRQDLFDLRYAFYRKVREMYVAVAQYDRPYDGFDFYDLAEEASFLFGDDVAKHIASMTDRKIPEQVKYAGIVDDWFIKPFNKYLKLK